MSSKLTEKQKEKIANDFNNLFYGQVKDAIAGWGDIDVEELQEAINEAPEVMRDELKKQLKREISWITDQLQEVIVPALDEVSEELELELEEVEDN